MEKNPPEKSPSFACPDDKKKQDADRSPSPDFIAIDAKSEGDHEAEDREEDREKVDEASSDLDSSLAKVSEEIDRFLSTLFTVEEKSNPPEIPNHVDQFCMLVEAMIAKYDSGEVPSKWCQVSEEDASLIEAVDRISKLTNALGEFPSESNYVSSHNRTSTVLHRAMLLLEEEFRALLEDSRSGDSDPGDLRMKQPSFSSNHEHDRCVLPEPDSARAVNFPAYSPEVVSNLNLIATAMISASYDKECYQVYSIARRNAFEESLNKLGFEKVSIDDVQKMQWDSLEGEIATWIKVFKRCVTINFSGELKLCEAVFSDHPSISDVLFIEITSGVVLQLLNLADAVAMTKRSAEKLFKILDMYETLHDLIQVIDSFFSDECANKLKSETSTARCRLGVAAVSIFCDLENSIKSDTGKTPVPGGAVHPLTRYIMNYLKYTCEYKDTLEQIFQEHQKMEQSDGPDAETETTPCPYNNNQTPKPSPFSVQLVTVMDLLDLNLEVKSKLYKDLSLSYIFLMNNGRYIMQKIKGSAEIHELMGNTWSRKRSSDLRQYHKNYQRETWSKVLGCLRDEGLQVNGKVSKPVLKERFKSFNAMFDEIHKTQSSWVVSDEQLQSELRVSISAVVIPAYRSFLGRFRQYLDSGRQSEKYIKYQPDDIETSVDELFDGNAMSMARRRT
ncbi:hypothetical protein HHK36_025224 [Tetracentron sinense]|uniref:Exocyst subunit Exo70 family protein n=1 Tax=Tetracentron sinense TaxID=13715 RepID=A0A834YRH5_TETSI|nr:hypothetical protein HHK36_025224 [Tetracentron sinense]